MSARVVGYSRSTATDFFYVDDDLVIDGDSVTVDAKGGWPFNTVLGENVPMNIGDVISVTVNMWCAHDPDVRIGHFDDPSTFVTEPEWVALDAIRADQWFSRTWYRTVTAEMIVYQFVDVLLVQGDGSSSVFTDETGTGTGDGGEVYVVGWTGVSTLRNAYSVQSVAATVHTPDTSDIQVLNFYIGGGGAGGDSADRLPTQTPDVGTDIAFSQVLNDNNAGSPTFEDEFYGVGLYQPADGSAEVGHWETPAANDALLVGIGPPAGSVAVGDPIFGVVHIGSLT